MIIWMTNWCLLAPPSACLKPNSRPSPKQTGNKHHQTKERKHAKAKKKLLIIFSYQVFAFQLNTGITTYIRSILSKSNKCNNYHAEIFQFPFKFVNQKFLFNIFPKCKQLFQSSVTFSMNCLLRISTTELLQWNSYYAPPFTEHVTRGVERYLAENLNTWPEKPPPFLF